MSIIERVTNLVMNGDVMADDTIDRRVARTRATLHEALMSLILKKRYEAITVADICDAANLGRSTFYSHYGSKDDLKRSGLQNIRKVLVDHQKAPTPAPHEGQGWGFSLAMFEHARDHVHHYRAMVGGSGGALALGRIRQMLAEVVRDERALAGHRDSADAVPPELVVQYVVGAYMAVLTWWLDGGMKLPPERVDAMFQRLATEGVGRSQSG